MEHVFFQDSQVIVTAARVVVNGQTYAVRNITSVCPITYPPNRGGMAALLILGFIAVLVGGAASWLIMGIGIVAIVIAVVQMIRARPIFGVLLITSAGEMSALRHHDKLHVARIVGAIGQAIAFRPHI